MTESRIELLQGRLRSPGLPLLLESRGPRANKFALATPPCLALVLFALFPAAVSAQAPVTDAEAVGWHLFFDKLLSRPETFSCESCHRPETGFADGLRRAEGWKELTELGIGE